MDAKVISDYRLRKAEIEQMQIEIMGYKKREVEDIERIREQDAEIELLRIALREIMEVTSEGDTYCIAEQALKEGGRSK